MKKHRVLVIGVGSIGERHLRCFGLTGRAEMSLAETRDDLRGDVGARYGVTSAFADWRDALKSKPDVAVVATPAPSHVEIATELARSGVHVLIEKPLSNGPEGLDALKAAGKGVVAGVAYVYRQHPLLRKMRSAIADGLIGKPVEIVAVCGQHFPTYRPAYRDIYYRSHETGGGAIQDALTHVINAGEWVLGPLGLLVADASRQVLDGVEVEDTAHIIGRHGGVLASYSLNQHQAPNEVTITVVGDRGTARFEFHASRWRWMLELAGAWNEEAIEPLERDFLFIAQANEFLDAVEGRCPPACSIDEAEQTLLVNLAALESVRDRSWKVVSHPNWSGRG